MILKYSFHLLLVVLLLRCCLHFESWMHYNSPFIYSRNTYLLSLWCHLFLFANSHFYFKSFFNSLTNASMTKISHVNCTYIQPICKFKLPNKFIFRWRNIKVLVISVFKLLQFIWLHRLYFSFLPIYISTLKHFLTL